MKWFKILGIVLILLGISFFVGSNYIRSQVEQGKTKVRKAQSAVDATNSAASVDPNLNLFSRAETGPVQKQISGCMHAGRVENRVAIVTGAKQGIGFSIAELLVKEGAFVILTDVNDKGGVKAVERLGKEHALFLHHDVSQEKDWENVFEQAIQMKGRVDILVNNAGISGLSEGFGPQNPEDLSLDDFRKIQTINTEGTFLGCRYAIKFMKAHGGSIINISSRSADVGVPTMCAYAATKAAIKNLTKSVALWCCAKKYPLRCNSVLPAAILTPFWDPMIGGKDQKEKIAKISEEIPLGQMGEPLDVAYAVLYLASSESKFITGTEIVIDGGILAGSSALPGVIQTKE